MPIEPQQRTCAVAGGVCSRRSGHGVLVVIGGARGRDEDGRLVGGGRSQAGREELARALVQPHLNGALNVQSQHLHTITFQMMRNGCSIFTRWQTPLAEPCCQYE